MENKRVMLFGRNGVGKSTIANVLVTGGIETVVFKSSDGDSSKVSTSNIQVERGRSWTVTDTVGLGNAESSENSSNKYAILKLASFLTKPKLGANYVSHTSSGYSHIIYVQRRASRITTLDEVVWRLFASIFAGAENAFIVLFTGADKEWLQDNQASFPAYFKNQTILVTDIPPIHKVPELERRNEEIRKKSIEKFEADLEDHFIKRGSQFDVPQFLANPQQLRTDLTRQRLPNEWQELLQALEFEMRNECPEIPKDVSKPQTMDTEELRMTSNLETPNLIHLKDFLFEFNPHQVICKYNVIVSSDTLEMVFAHVEGMASLFGIGLPFSRVLVGSHSKIVIEEMSEDYWRNLWMASYEGSFELVIFKKSWTKSDSSTSTTSDLSMAEAHSKLGVGVEGINHYKAHSKLGVGVEGINHYEFFIGNMFESNSTFDVGGVWTNWLDQVLKKKKAQLEEKKNQGNPDDGGDATRGEEARTLVTGKDHHHESKGEASTSSMPVMLSPRTNVSEMEDRSNQQNKIKILKVIVKMKQTPGKFLREYCYDNLEGGRELVPVEVKIEDDILCTCVIKPTLIIDFQYNPVKMSKVIRVTFDVEYQIQGNIDDQSKFGWYQNNLGVSFHCAVSGATSMEEHGINSPRENKDVEIMGSSANSKASQMDHMGRLKTKFGPGLLRGEVAVSSTRQSQVSSSDVNQVLDRISIPRMAGTGFTITDFSYNEKVACDAYLLPSIHTYNVRSPADRYSALASGMFSNLRTNVHGRWRLNGDDIAVPHEFLAKRKLFQYLLSTRHSKSEDPDMLSQIITRTFIVNHSFSHMEVQAYKQVNPIEWLLINPETPSPVIHLLK